MWTFCSISRLNDKHLVLPSRHQWMYTSLTAAHLFLMKHCLTDPAKQDILGHPVQHKHKILIRVWCMYSMWEEGQAWVTCGERPPHLQPSRLRHREITSISLFVRLSLNYFHGIDMHPDWSNHWDHIQRWSGPHVTASFEQCTQHVSGGTRWRPAHSADVLCDTGRS